MITLNFLAIRSPYHHHWLHKRSVIKRFHTFFLYSFSSSMNCIFSQHFVSTKPKITFHWKYIKFTLMFCTALCFFDILLQSLRGFYFTFIFQWVRLHYWYFSEAQINKYACYWERVGRHRNSQVLANIFFHLTKRLLSAGKCFHTF